MSRTEALLQFIGDELLTGHDDGDLTADAELLASRRVNSLGLMRLIAFIRDEFGAEVPYEDILVENFRTVRSIDDYLARKEGG